MQCLYCGKPIGLLKGLTDGEFCTSQHRERYKEVTKLALNRLLETQTDDATRRTRQQMRREVPPPPKPARSRPAPSFGRFASEAFYRSLAPPPDPKLAVMTSADPLDARNAALGIDPVYEALRLAQAPVLRHSLVPTRPPVPVCPCAAKLEPVAVAEFRVTVVRSVPDHSLLLTVDTALAMPAEALGDLPLAGPAQAAAELVAPIGLKFEPIPAQAAINTRTGMAAVGLEMPSAPASPGWAPLVPRVAALAPVAPISKAEPLPLPAPQLRRPSLHAALLKFALRSKDVVFEEVPGADVTAAPVGTAPGPNLGSSVMLPALASLFNYGRPARSVFLMQHNVLGLRPLNRLAVPTAFKELPVRRLQPVVPRSSGLRIVETFEYLKPLEEPRFDLLQYLVHLWKTAPAYARYAAAAVCLAVFLWASVSEGGMTSIVETGWGQIRDGMQKRAAVQFTEDFRSGMEEWEGQSDWSRSWQSQKAGYVRPGRLALYQPSMKMKSYRVEFLVQVEQQAASWAYRATDEENYYAAKITLVKPGPLPQFSLVRYPVTGGKPGLRVEIPIRVLMHNDTPYRVQLTVNGRDYFTSVEGQLVDFWRDDRLQTGGVGFFSDTGESARLYWMRLSYQDDFIGRVLAHFYPNPDHGRSSRDSNEPQEGVIQSSLEPDGSISSYGNPRPIRPPWGLPRPRQSGRFAPGWQTG